MYNQCSIKGIHRDHFADPLYQAHNQTDTYGFDNTTTALQTDAAHDTDDNKNEFWLIYF